MTLLCLQQFTNHLKYVTTREQDSSEGAWQHNAISYQRIFRRGVNKRSNPQQISILIPRTVSSVEYLIQKHLIKF